MRASLFALALCTAGAATAVETLTGRADVLDADTITVGGVTARLQRVAAPELTALASAAENGTPPGQDTR